MKPHTSVHVSHLSYSWSSRPFRVVIEQTPSRLDNTPAKNLENMKAPEHTEVHKGDVTTTVQYLQEGSKNTRYFGKGKEVNIGKYDDVSVIMHDARPNREEYTLENGGFALVQHESTVCCPSIPLILLRERR